MTAGPAQEIASLQPEKPPEDVQIGMEAQPKPRKQKEKALEEGRQTRLTEYFLKYGAPEKERQLYAQLKDLRTKKTTLEDAIPTVMIMAEMKKPRDTFILGRGQYDNPKDKVTAGVPAFLPPMAPGLPMNRLGLAKWIVSPANPLTARVAVNHFWQEYFGTGIVKTSEDFGSQGEPPSNPQLLDWLATEFVRTGWNVKAMQRLIVTSATYRQSSRVTPELAERDPENRLLARGPRFRLPAELIRDNALAVSGLLDDRIGGPSVFPYQPKGLWEEMAFGAGFTGQTYTESTGRDLYRRSMYTVWKRTVPPPALVTFDAPDREKCTARRSVTNTPLQALVLLNDPTYVEAARFLAARMLTQGGKTPAGRINYAFRLATGRIPDPQERAVLLRGGAGSACRLPPAQRRGGGIADRGRVQERSQARPQRTRRLDHRGQHHFESRRDDYASNSAEWECDPMMDPKTTTGKDLALSMTRRHFFRRSTAGIALGIPALASLLAQDGFAAADGIDPKTGGLLGFPNFAPKAKRVIFLHQSGAPSQIDLFDHKPNLTKMEGHRPAGFGPHGPAHYRHDFRPINSAGGAFHLQLRPGGKIRRDAQRTAAAPREDRGRYHPDPNGLYGRD